MNQQRNDLPDWVLQWGPDTQMHDPSTFTPSLHDSPPHSRHDMRLGS